MGPSPRSKYARCQGRGNGLDQPRIFLAEGTLICFTRQDNYRPDRPAVSPPSSASAVELHRTVSVKANTRQIEFAASVMTTFSHATARDSHFGPPSETRLVCPTARLARSHGESSTPLTPWNLRERRGLRSNEGSNPPLSATQSGLQRKPVLVSRQHRELCPFSAISARQTGLRRTDYRGGDLH
jgi:hypothetical protein